MYKLGYGLNEWDDRCVVFQYRENEKYDMFKDTDCRDRRIWMTLEALRLRLYWRREQQMNVNQERTAIKDLEARKLKNRYKRTRYDKPKNRTINMLTWPGFNGTGR